ncbi:unnamed protein product [Camellia sinensis]
MIKRPSNECEKSERPAKRTSMELVRIDDDNDGREVQRIYKISLSSCPLPLHSLPPPEVTSLPPTVTLHLFSLLVLKSSGSHLYHLHQLFISSLSILRSSSFGLRLLVISFRGCYGV